MTIFFGSDWHLGHERILELCGRPFPDVATMNQAIIDRANEATRPGDVLILLGDIVMGQMVDTLPLIAQLHATPWLIPGNHDRISPWYPGVAQMTPERRSAWMQRWWAAYTDAGFEIHDTARTIGLPGVTARIAHFPYDRDTYGEGRFPDDAYPVDEGRWLLHGHVHQMWRQRGRQINVGVDAWNGYPVSADHVAAMVHAGPAMLDPIPWTN
jgi:calcineurin-like phosphoesterase family protein